MPDKYRLALDTNTKFLFSTSGSQSSIEKHNDALGRLGVNLSYFTFSHDIEPEIYAGLIRTPIARGAAVTGKGGLKSTIIPFLDEVEPLAKKTLAVNTVVNREGKLFGYNTDAYGLKTALQRGIEQSQIAVSTAVIYGNGGVSGVAFKVLEDLGIQVTIVGRDAEKVYKKRRALGIEDVPHFEGPYDLVVDATPISSNENFLEAPGFSELIGACKMVFCHNMPEKDNRPNYLRQYCQDHSLFYIPGKWMYVAQLIKQYSLYFEGYTTPNGTSISEQDIIEAWALRF